MREDYEGNAFIVSRDLSTVVYAPAPAGTTTSTLSRKSKKHR